MAYLKNNLYKLELDVEMGEADSEGVLKRSPFKQEILDSQESYLHVIDKRVYMKMTMLITEATE